MFPEACHDFSLLSLFKLSNYTEPVGYPNQPPSHHCSRTLELRGTFVTHDVRLGPLLFPTLGALRSVHFRRFVIYTGQS